MRQSLRRWLSAAGVLAAAGGLAYGQGVAAAAPAAPAASSAKTPPYVPPNHNLYYGDTGPAVRSVQRRLTQLHYYPGPIDGIYGEDTEQAVWAFKEVQGLPLNEATNSVITAAFRNDLVDPRRPWPIVKHAPANRIEINLHIQVLVLYKNNRPEFILHVSSGGNCLVDQGCNWITPDGNYSALYFDPGWVQVPLGEMYNPVFFIGTAYAIHGDIPVPFYPDSHGCVRIWMDAAQWFHNYVDVNSNGTGTPIYIRGIAPYNPLANQ